MTPLEPRKIRDANGIDTFERALLYAALMLRASNTNVDNVPAGKANKYLNASRIVVNLANITQRGIEPTVKIEMKLPYDNQRALRHGGNFVESLGSCGNIDGSFNEPAAPTEPNFFPIPADPTWVTTLERYAAWCATNLIGGHAALNNKVAPPVTVDFLEEDTSGASLLIGALLKLGLYEYLRNNDLISAVIPEIKIGTEPLKIETGSTLIHLFRGASFQNLEYAINTRQVLGLGGSSTFQLSDIVVLSIGISRLIMTSSSLVVEQEIAIQSQQRLNLAGATSSRTEDGNIASSGIILLRINQGESEAKVEDGNRQSESYQVFRLESESTSSVGARPPEPEELKLYNVWWKLEPSMFGTFNSISAFPYYSVFNADGVNGVRFGGGSYASVGKPDAGYRFLEIFDIRWKLEEQVFPAISNF